MAKVANLNACQHVLTVFNFLGSNYYIRILSTIDRELLKPSASVALHKHSNALVDVLPPEADSSIAMLTADEKPNVAYADIGGMDIQKQEMREAVELPLTHFELYKQIGIDPPRGVLMYGPPGCGKTMLAKAVAHHTTAAFIRVVGSEFVQKYLGEGPRMVRDVFRLAKENAPAIIFIDEIDAIATKRFDAQTGGKKESVSFCFLCIVKGCGRNSGQVINRCWVNPWLDHCVLYLNRALKLSQCSLPHQKYYWVLVNCEGNLANML